MAVRVSRSFSKHLGYSTGLNFVFILENRITFLYKNILAEYKILTTRNKYPYTIIFPDPRGDGVD